MNFKQYSLITEINSQTILYHRSDKTYKSGDIITGAIDHGKEHWLKSIYFEKKLEAFRQKFVPSAPSKV